MSALTSTTNGSGQVLQSRPVIQSSKNASSAMRTSGRPSVPPGACSSSTGVRTRSLVLASADTIFWSIQEKTGTGTPLCASGTKTRKAFQFLEHRPAFGTFGRSRTARSTSSETSPTTSSCTPGTFSAGAVADTTHLTPLATNPGTLRGTIPSINPVIPQR